MGLHRRRVTGMTHIRLLLRVYISEFMTTALYPRVTSSTFRYITRGRPRPRFSIPPAIPFQSLTRPESHHNVSANIRAMQDLRLPAPSKRRRTDIRFEFMRHQERPKPCPHPSIQGLASLLWHSGAGAVSTGCSAQAFKATCLRTSPETGTLGRRGS